MDKVIIIEGTSSEKDNVRLLFVKGEKGDNNTLTIGTVTTAESEASASITGDSPNQVLNLGLPKGDPNTLSIGTVQSGATANASITGDSPNQTLNLVLPKGDKGDKGDTGDVSANEIYYIPNTTLNLGAGTLIHGYVKYDTSYTLIRFNIITPKKLDYINLITVTSLKFAIYGVGGQIISSGEFKNKIDGDVSILPTKDGLYFDLMFDNNEVTNVVRETPVVAEVELNNDVSMSLTGSIQ